MVYLLLKFLVFTVCLDVYLQVVYGPVVVLVSVLRFAGLGYEVYGLFLISS